MKKIIMCAVLGLLSAVSVMAQTGSITFNLTDNRQTIVRNIDRNLMLRVMKDSSVTQKNFGWIVEVVRRSSRRYSRNLIYTNKTGVTADQSQVMAWQVGSADFPNQRKIRVRGFPLVVDIRLLDPRAEGATSNARFLSGKLIISWRRP